MDMFAIVLGAALAQVAPLPTQAPNPNEGTPPAIESLVKRPVAHLTPGPGAVLIVDSGSTNAAGFTIALDPSGSASFTTGAGIRHGHVEIATARQLFAALKKAGALSALPVRPCMKSASFGSSLTLEYRGARSPDLACAANAAERALSSAASAVAGALGVRSGPRKVHLLQ
ncbi:MAG: hypothetical protein GIW95_12680 [Candidatus Eremiobacteraeota bacterium]|nr:hypothetical protein [Candidatus Eremiobacteraeota bacterium]